VKLCHIICSSPVFRHSEVCTQSLRCYGRQKIENYPIVVVVLSLWVSRRRQNCFWCTVTLPLLRG